MPQFALRGRGSIKALKLQNFLKSWKRLRSYHALRKITLDKSNYRPVSILPFISKIFERAIYDQLIVYFNNIFHPSLSAFRSGYGCQTALLKIVEDWKEALDNNKYVAAILMDLSKAFDCLPHNLLIENLKTYKALKLLLNYLMNRKSIRTHYCIQLYWCVDIAF
jgi:hypothetical protein